MQKISVRKKILETEYSYNYLNLEKHSSGIPKITMFLKNVLVLVSFTLDHKGRAHLRYPHDTVLKKYLWRIKF